MRDIGKHTPARLMPKRTRAQRACQRIDVQSIACIWIVQDSMQFIGLFHGRTPVAGTAASHKRDGHVGDNIHLGGEFFAKGQADGVHWLFGIPPRESAAVAALQHCCSPRQKTRSPASVKTASARYK